ncbi:MAG: hypothetical protein FGM24_06480 [Candidatus Kapabacteria bacterium]|nr:hypothetical protein [Candidatus Kapabacteria bacterium]
MAALYPFVLTLVLQWLAGFGVMATLRSTLPRSIVAPIALLLGAFLETLVVVAVDRLGIGLSFTSVSLGMTLVVLATHARWSVVKSWYGTLVSSPSVSIRMYDVVAFIIAAYLVFVGMWAAYYWPVTPFDAMAGIDLMARQSVIDGTLNNSVLTDPALAGRLSNQPFYAPFAMLQQVIYRLMGWPFGQLWLPVMSFAFFWVMWALFRRYAHPFIADVLLLLLVMVPELHGYTYLLQTDFLNAVYVSIGVIILGLDIERRDNKNLVIAALFMAAGCWSRTETIAVIGLGMIASFPLLRNAVGMRKALSSIGVVIAASVTAFAIWHVWYFYGVFPVRPESGTEIVGFSIAKFTDVVSATFGDVIADMGLWGWTMPLFVLVLALSVLRNKSVGDRWLLVWTITILLALEIVGTLFASAVVGQTIRRGVFKLIPLMYLFMARSPVVSSLSAALQAWELGRGRNTASNQRKG